MNQTCYALVSSTQTPLALYCLSLQSMDRLVNAAHGSVFDTVTTATFNSSKVVLAPAAVLEAFENVVSPLFNRILKSIEQSKSLRALRDALLPKLFSGELPVNSAETIVTEST
jgi:type I restriction enzyme S subunit